MRQLGNLTEERDATRFTAFLVTQGILAHAEQEGSDWAIWVRDENDLQRARAAFEQFQAEPQHDRYQGVTKEADAIRRQENKKREQARKNVVEMRQYWNRPAARRMPLVITLIGLSILVTLPTGFGLGGPQKRSSVLDALVFVKSAPTSEPLTSPLTDVLQGQVWRLVTPIFLHFGPMHLVFNCYAIYFLGGQVEQRRGTGLFAVMVVVMAILSNLAQAYAPLLHLGGGADFGGLSGVVYGMFGYVWLRSRLDPASGFFMDPVTVVLLVGWFFLCFTPLMPNVANAAHAAGLLIGIVWAYLPLAWRS